MGLTLQASAVTLVQFPFNFLHFFLRESLFCWVLDGDLEFAATKKNQQPPHLLSNEEAISLPSISSAKLCEMAEKVRLDFQTLEQRLALRQSCKPPLSLELHSFDAPPSTRGCSSAPASPARRRRTRQEIKPDFQQFCDQLLEAHRLREQEKEVKKLQCALKASKKSRSRSAFDTFCQEVLLTTELSKKKREIKELREEVEMAKMERRDTEVKAENQASRDSHEDRPTENQVLDLENGVLRRELELLRLSQATLLLEQELSNDLEDRLFEEKSHYREWSTDSSRGEVATGDGYSTDGTDIELEDMTTMSSSSTCVGSPSPSPRKKAVRLSISSRTADRKGFVGFSFNPLYYGPGGAPSKRRTSAPAPSLVSRPPWRG
ncbi:hypothetical protein BKA70DRAFT_1512383 [Coprinopsis sp. MPI-PUGE-AT-0042]|nr:hypothetical protein BKA70DRAFT_1512383 [Coprinopsis sp. MPI-PUGE-AT-0042]